MSGRSIYCHRGHVSPSKASTSTSMRLPVRITIPSPFSGRHAANAESAQQASTSRAASAAGPPTTGAENSFIAGKKRRHALPSTSSTSSSPSRHKRVSFKSAPPASSPLIRRSSLRSSGGDVEDVPRKRPKPSADARHSKAAATSRSKNIRETLRQAVLDDTKDDLRKTVRELQGMQHELEEKAEARKIKIADLTFRLMEKERNEKELLDKAQSLSKSLEKSKKENRRLERQREEELINLNNKIKIADKRAAKAEMERAKMEAKKSVKRGSEAFFQDMLCTFKDVVESNLQCSICNELLVSTVTVTCGHSFCEECIEEWKAKKEDGRPNCPICRADIVSQVSNIVLDSYVDKAVENFFPDDAKKSRQEVMVDRKASKEARKKREVAQRRQQHERHRLGDSIRIYLTNGRPMRQLVIDSDSSDSDVSWSPRRTTAGANSSLIRSSPSGSSISLPPSFSSSSSSSSSSVSSLSSDSSSDDSVHSPDLRDFPSVSEEDAFIEGLINSGDSDPMDGENWSDDDDDDELEERFASAEEGNGGNDDETDFLSEESD